MKLWLLLLSHALLVVSQVQNPPDEMEPPTPPDADTEPTVPSGHNDTTGTPLNSIIKPYFCWTPWFDRDNPSGKGDYETLYHLRKDNPGEICDKPLGIEVRTISGQLSSSTGNYFYKIDTISGFVCRNRDQKSYQCWDYKVRFRCPIDFCRLPCWTQWFDRDDPTGTGDWEGRILLDFNNPGKICKKPNEIEVQTISGNPAASTGEIFHKLDPEAGFVCKNKDQRNYRQCSDYRVRFRCPHDFCDPPACWTPWFDRDDPSGSGDWESLFALRAEYPGQICTKPLEIQALTTSGNSVESTGNVITANNVDVGFLCENDKQKNWKKCADFKVRFRCPTEFCKDRICWTSWYDRDDQSGTGDWELLTDLRKENPNEICDTPLYIDVRTVDTNKPITQTGQQHHIYSPTEGFACRNDGQKGCKCQDYKVRFGCPCNCTKYVEDAVLEQLIMYI